MKKPGNYSIWKPKLFLAETSLKNYLWKPRKPLKTSETLKHIYNYFEAIRKAKRLIYLHI